MFKSGDRVILEKSINAIPSGCYKFISEIEGSFEFGVGSKIRVLLSCHAEPFLRKAHAPAALTHPNDFVPRYYELLRSLRNMPGDPNGPFSACYMDPELPIVKKFESSSPFETRQ
jgi:hypothetical protein